MDAANGYFDYCIPESCINNEKFPQIAKKILDYGYRTIAVEQVIAETNVENKKKKKKGESRESNDIVPSPIEFTKNKDYEDLKILNRLTIVFSNQDIFNKITNSSNYKKYHIIAIQPLTQQAFQYTCSSVDADIFTYNSETRGNYKLTRKLYNQLISKGYYFELLYGPAILDSTRRKNTIATAHLYHAVGKSRNIIISSGAINDVIFRSPYDVMNLSLILGLPEEKAKNAMLHFGRNVFIHSVGRRHGKTLMLVETVKDTNEKNSAEIMHEEEEMELDQPAQKKSKQ